MANYKKISTITTTGRTVYAMVSRDADGYFLATAKTSFASGAGYPVLSEHATMKGLYVLNTNDAAWDDGTYAIVAYSQAGASPAPASDTVLSFGTMRILNDLEISAINSGTSYQDGAIWIDTNNGAAGTTAYTNGTADNPVDSLADALTLATALGINQFRLLPGSSITFTGNQQNQSWIGYGATIAAGNNTNTGSYFEGVTLTGSCKGAIRARNCILTALENFNGYFESCILSGQLTPAIGDNAFAQCVGDGPAGAKNPTLILNAVGDCNIALSGYQGIMQVSELSGSDALFFDCCAGTLVLGADCSGGTVTRRGFHTLIDNSATATVYDLTAAEAVADAVWDEAISGHSGAGSTGATVTGIKTQTDLIPASPAAVGSAMTLATDAVDADALADDAIAEIQSGISTSVFSETVEGTLTLLQVLRILLAEAAGITTGSRTATLCFRDQADTKNRITGTMDTTGNRTSITLDVS